MWRKIIDDYRMKYLNNWFEIKLIFCGLSCMLQFSEFVWALSYSVWDVFTNFLLIDTQQIEVRFVAIKIAFLSH